VDSIIYFNVKKDIGSQQYDILCAYLGNKALQDANGFYSALERAIKKSDSLPDCLVVYLPCHRLSECRQYWNNEELHDSFLNRLSNDNVCYTKKVFFVEINDDSFKISVEEPIDATSIKLNDKDVTLFYSQGLNELVKKNNVLHIAPAGHTFKHPSGRINKLFIQSRELASTETELQFVAKGIHSLFPKVNWTAIKTIFIDTMGIYAIVNEVLRSVNSSAHIESYHSYSSLADLTLPTEEYLFVISASTSGGMAENLVSRGFSKDKIITLIDIKKRDKYSGVLIDLSSTDLLESVSSVDGNETDIELVGEHFSYKAKPPKQITIGLPHRPKSLVDILNLFGLKGLNAINQKVSVINKSPLLSLKPEVLHSNDKFIDWLINELAWTLPSSVNTIVYSDDGASFELASQASHFINNNTGKKPRLLEWPKVKVEDFVGCKGVLVVSAFAGDGGRLRQISRDLREYENEIIPRHFLVGVGLPQSMESWNRLEQFLVRNATPRLYSFSTWKVLPIGPDNVQNSWGELAKLASQAQSIVIEDDLLKLMTNEKASECFDALAELINSCSHTLLPNSKGEPLKITEGFLFFNGLFDQNIDEVSQSEPLLAISSVLQTAREHSDPEKCLRPTNYQSVIISPENFLRFNDDILQACILRASLPSELDYSSDQHLSELMKEFLIKVFTRHAVPFGYAALEFAAALAVGKLKLKKDHTIELIEKSLNEVGSESKELAGFLLMSMSNLSKKSVN
tara:strand:+ start:13194 stop:15416 length:2223 start_codon:yes stop_codon:yes gene_type:complete